jgi:hypothetical protein
MTSAAHAIVGVGVTAALTDLLWLYSANRVPLRLQAEGGALE